MSADSVMPIEVLREIRNAVDRMSDRLSERISELGERIDNVEKGLGARIDNVEKSLGARIDGTNQRLETLERRTTQGFIETNTKLADLTGRVDHLSEQTGDLAKRVDRMGDRIENVLTGQMGQDLRDLKNRMVVVEEKLIAGAHERPAPPYGEEPKK